MRTPLRQMASIGGNFAWMTAGNSVYAACQWAMVSVLAHLGSPEIVGQYALGLAVSTPVLMLAQLNLRTVLVTDVAAEYRFREYRDVRIVSLALACLGIGAMALFEHSAQERLVISLVAAAQAVEWIADIYFGLFQRQEQMRRIAAGLCLHGVLSVAALGAGVAITGKLLAGLAAMLAVRLLVFFLYDSTIAMRGLEGSGVAPAAPAGVQSGRWRRAAAIVRTALPLGVVLMIGSFSVNVPRYFIAQSLGPRALGIFAGLASLSTAANLLVNALGQAVTPKLARLYQSGNRAGFRRMSFQIAGAGALLGMCTVAGAAIAGRPVLSVLFGREYAAESMLLVVLSAASGAGFVASLLGYAITAGRRFGEQMPLQIASVGGTSLACLVLVPKWGLTGAGAAIGIGYLVQILGEGWILRSILHEREKDEHLTLDLAKEPAC